MINMIYGHLKSCYVYLRDILFWKVVHTTMCVLLVISGKKLTKVGLEKGKVVPNFVFFFFVSQILKSPCVIHVYVAFIQHR